MEGQHMSQKVFAQFTGISEGSLSGVFNGRTRPTLQMVDAIHTHLPNLSVEWLMYGTGPMYMDEKPEAASGEEQGDSAVEGVVGGLSPEVSPTLFDVQEGKSVQRGIRTLNNIPQMVAKYIDKPERHITEIRIFFDDQTWETFVPKK